MYKIKHVIFSLYIFILAPGKCSPLKTINNDDITRVSPLLKSVA